MDGERVRRSERVKQTPKHFKEFEVDLSAFITHSKTNDTTINSILCPLSNYIAYDNFSNIHVAFLSAISKYDKPKNYSQVMRDER